MFGIETFKILCNTKLKEFNINSVDELIRDLRYYKIMEKERAHLEYTISKINLEHENEMSKLKVLHENEIMSLNNAINLEKVNIKHQYFLKEKEFEVEKETLKLKLENEINKKRQESFEKNFNDLKEGLQLTQDNTVKMLSVVMGGVSIKKESLNLNSDKDTKLITKKNL
jgi:hypothetical protein